MKYCITIFFILIQFVSKAQAENKLFDQGNELYKQAKYSEAEAAYKKALNGWSKIGESQYNLALTLHKQQKKSEAIDVLKKFVASTDDGVLKAKAYYNLGVIYGNTDMTAASIEAYKNALKQNPNDAEARENLQKALIQTPKNNKQEQKENKKNDSPKAENKNPKPQPQKPQNNKLKQLQQKEKELKKRIQNKQSSKTTTGGTKDW